MSRYYVYRLIDPRDEKTFYVGKGQKGRIHAHEHEARKSSEVCSKKINKIKEIWLSGLEIKKEIVARFSDEIEAYCYEANLIESIGLENLTNLIPGGSGSYSRKRRVARARIERRIPLSEAVAKMPEVLVSRFFAWFEAGGHKGTQWTFRAIDPAYRFNAVVSDVVYNKIIPGLVKAIAQDEKAYPIFAKRMRPYGLELV